MPTRTSIPHSTNQKYHDRSPARLIGSSPTIPGHLTHLSHKSPCTYLFSVSPHLSLWPGLAGVPHRQPACSPPNHACASVLHRTSGYIHLPRTSNTDDECDRYFDPNPSSPAAPCTLPRLTWHSFHRFHLVPSHPRSQIWTQAHGPASTNPSVPVKSIPPPIPSHPRPSIQPSPSSCSRPGVCMRVLCVCSVLRVCMSERASLRV